MIAEIKWFYRVSELPEAVYLLLMEDRKNGKIFFPVCNSCHFLPSFFCRPFIF